MGGGTSLLQQLGNSFDCFLQLILWQTGFHLHSIEFQPKEVHNTAQLLLVPINSYTKIGTDIVKFRPKLLCFLKLLENRKEVV